MNQKLIDEAKAALSYCPETGIFFWVNPKRKPFLIGRAAGKQMPNGYVYLKLNGANVSASRLAWAWLNGPIGDKIEIDHINRIRTDNRATNLRAVDHLTNKKNRAFKPNKVGISGVSIHQKTGLYRVRGYGPVKYTRCIGEAWRLARERIAGE